MDRLSSAPTDCRVPDPTDAKADGNFGTHRAGYGDRLDRIIATARKGWTLAAGEGLVLVQEIDRLRDDLKYAQALLNQLHDSERLQDEIDRLRGELELVSSEAADAFNDRDAMEGMYRHHVAVALDAIAKLNHAQGILAALREPSDFVIEAIDATAWDQGCARLGLPACALVARAAVAAAEQEVQGE